MHGRGNHDQPATGGLSAIDYTVAESLADGQGVSVHACNHRFSADPTAPDATSIHWGTHAPNSGSHGGMLRNMVRPMVTAREECQ